MKYKIISIDFQKDFVLKGGKSYRGRPAIKFIKDILIPYLIDKNIKIAEIVSDYRQPRLGDRGNCCKPGEWGYESEIPKIIKNKNIWIKCMNSPIWTRNNIGDSNKKPGLPFQDSKKFNEWIKKTIGSPKITEIILIGLTLDCCVLCTAQEFNFRGYKVKILKDATDTYSGDQKEKDDICKSVITNWASIITWKEFQNYKK